MNQKCPSCSALIAPNEPACRACGSPWGPAPNTSPASPPVNPPAPGLPNAGPPNMDPPNPNPQARPDPFNNPSRPGPAVPNQAPPAANYGPPATPPPYPRPQGPPQTPSNLPPNSYNNRKKPGSKTVLFAVILVIFGLVCFGSYAIFFNKSDNSTDETSQDETEDDKTDNQDDSQTGPENTDNQDQNGQNQAADENQDPPSDNPQNTGNNPTFAEVFGVTEIAGRYDIAEVECEAEDLDEILFSVIFRVEGYQEPEDPSETIQYYRCLAVEVFALADFNEIKSLVYGNQLLACNSGDASTIINSPSNLYYKMTTPDGQQFVIAGLPDYHIENFESYDASIEKFNYCE